MDSTYNQPLELLSFVVIILSTTHPLVSLSDTNCATGVSGTGDVSDICGTENCTQIATDCESDPWCCADTIRSAGKYCAFNAPPCLLSDHIILQNHPDTEEWWIAFFMANYDLLCGGEITNVEIKDNNLYSGEWLTFDAAEFNNYGQYSFLHQDKIFTLPITVRVTKNDPTETLIATDIITTFNSSAEFDTGLNFCASTDTQETDKADDAVTIAIIATICCVVFVAIMISSVVYLVRRKRKAAKLSTENKSDAEKIEPIDHGQKCKARPIDNKTDDDTEVDLLIPTNLNERDKLAVTAELQSVEEAEDKDVNKEVAKQEVKEWLENTVEFPQYYALFLNHGIEDLRGVQYLEKEDLQRMGIVQIGHQNKIIHYAQRINEAEGQEGIVDHDEQRDVANTNYL